MAVKKTAPKKTTAKKAPTKAPAKAPTSTKTTKMTPAARKKAQRLIVAYGVARGKSDQALAAALAYTAKVDVIPEGAAWPLRGFRRASEGDDWYHIDRLIAADLPVEREAILHYATTSAVDSVMKRLTEQVKAAAA